MTSILYSNDPTEWELTEAVVIVELYQPSAPKFTGAERKLHLVGQFPWGPANTLLDDVDAKATLELLFGECEDLQNYGGFRTLIGKSWGGMELVRVEASDAVSATRTLDDGAADSYVVTAKYKTAAGNQIKIKHTKIDANTFDVEVKWNTKTETFKAVTFDAPGLSGIDCSWVTFALDPATGTMPDSDVASVNLAGGLNGTLVPLDWTGSAVSLKGLQVLRQGSDGGVWLAAEYTSPEWIVAIRDAIDVKLGHGIVQSSPLDTFAANETVAAAVADERLFLSGHRVEQVIEGTKMDVDLAPFLAAILCNVSPNLSPAEDRWEKYLKSIVGLVSGVELSRPFWIAADQAGMNMLERRSTGGFRFHMGITSNPASGKTQILRRRMTDFVNGNIASALASYRNKPPIPTHRRGAKLSMTQRLTLMLGSEAAPDSQMIESFSVKELSVTPTTVTYEIKVKLFGEMRYLIALVTVGENVVVEEVQ